MNAERDLQELLLDLFTPNEFVAFTRNVLHERRLAHSLPSTSVGAEMYFFEAVQTLRRRGLIDRDLFVGLLTQAKPGSTLAKRVVTVAAGFNIHLSASTPTSASGAGAPTPNQRGASPSPSDVYTALIGIDRSLFNIIMIKFNPPAKVLEIQDISDRAMALAVHASQTGQLDRLLAFIRQHAPGALP